MPILKTPDGQLRDEIRVPLYDSRVMDSATTPVGIYSFFTDIQGKSKARTNLLQPGALQRGVSYRVMGLALDVQCFESANVKAIPTYMENSSLKLKIGEKDYWEGPMSFLSGRMSQFEAISAAAAPTDHLYQRFGGQSPQPIIFAGKHVVDIPPLQSFRVDWTVASQDMTATDITNATLAADTRLIWIFSMKGIQRRPVQ